ncbi:MAG: hypothetical protein U0836_09405 [Pirellulales bacterium]
MNHERRLCYLGEDGDFFESVAAGISGRGWALEWSDCLEVDGSEPFDSWDWRRVLLVDLASGGPDDVERLVRFRKRYPGVPWIAVAQGAQFPLTTCSLARMHGAEAIFYKPCYDWEGLCEVVQAALARIAHWEQAMDEAAALNAA